MTDALVSQALALHRPPRPGVVTRRGAAAYRVGLSRGEWRM